LTHCIQKLAGVKEKYLSPAVKVSFDKYQCLIYSHTETVALGIKGHQSSFITMLSKDYAI
jgi:hypothetical protein